ncbi:LTA synthase family protein [Flavitalea sp.]|nr:LTA synthase family protein [Flavitalea sp.]
MKTLFKLPLKGKFSTAYVLFLFYLGISFLTRLVLYISVASNGFSLATTAGLFGIGLIYDIVVGFLITVPAILLLVFQSDFIYRRKIFPIVVTLWISVILVLRFTGLVPKDFSPALFIVLLIYVILRLLIYITIYLLPYSFRIKWRKISLYFMLSVIIFLLSLNAVSEWFFWNEFFSRYNFIAVDYLVYTSEVLGNIWESYPIGWILVALAFLSGTIIYHFHKYVNATVSSSCNFYRKWGIAIFIFFVCGVGLFSIRESLRHFSRNEFANSLAGNGLFEFGVAYQQNELDFHKFYRGINDSLAFKIVKKDLQAPNVKFLNKDSFSIERDITYAENERKLNVVLITIESLSAEYMRAFGNPSNITPSLDSLADRSLLFTNMYASGNRTVRGLEALSLSIPPTPGESIIKRPDIANLFSLGSVLKSKGYITQYLYGGYSYFDNMKSFFSGNGYTVIDRSVIPDSKIHYQNIWGVADEDLFDLALQTLDSNASTNKPFFSQIMTVSNHRPYTYPEGRIDISPSTKTRYGAVKYTDYAIARFLKMASKKSWFSNTIFVIVSDHCAGSAGRVELPVTGYHIPLIIYAPGIIDPGTFDPVCAQIDIAPTIMGLLKLDYRSKFFGRDIFNTKSLDQRAFLSTYQGLGYLQNGSLVIQSPVKKIDQYVPDFKTGDAVRVKVDERLADLAIAYYQCADWLLRNKKQTAN